MMQGGKQKNIIGNKRKKTVGIYHCLFAFSPGVWHRAFGCTVFAENLYLFFHRIFSVPIINLWKPMEIFLFCCHAASNMAFCFVDFQYTPHGFCQLWVDFFHTVGNVFMHRRFTDTEFLRCFSDGGIGVYHEFCHFHSSLLNIAFQQKHSSKYILIKNICIFSMSYDKESTIIAIKKRCLIYKNTMRLCFALFSWCSIS